MATVQYTALRSLTLGHVAGSLQTAEIEFSEISRNRAIEKNAVRAVSGRTETLYHHSQTTWRFTLAPVAGMQRELVIEFLDSTAIGRSFLCWPYGSESAPIRLVRTDSGSPQTPFMRRGARDRDLFQYSITAIELT